MNNTTLNAPQKACPQCSTKCHVKKKFCECGHEFQTRRATFIKRSDTFEQIAKSIPPTFSHYVNKAKRGSVKAMVALKCIDCSGFQRREITLCTQSDCALYPIRPFQGSLKNNEEINTEADKDIDEETDTEIGMEINTGIDTEIDADHTES